MSAFLFKTETTYLFRYGAITTGIILYKKL